MSWSFDYTGTPAAVKAAVIKFCDKTAENYKGTQEANDILFCKERVVSLIDSLHLGPDGYVNWNGVSAKGNGSHSTSGPNRVISASFGCGVVRTALALDEPTVPAPAEDKLPG